MRRPVLLIAAALVVVGGLVAAVVVAKRTVRWNDARTMPPPLEAAIRAYGKGDAAAGLRSVGLLISRYRAPAWEGRARVLAATQLSRAGNDREIVALLPQELTPSDPLAAHASLLRARGWLARREYDRAAESASRAVAEAGFPAADEARQIHAQALDASGRWRAALAALDGGTGAAIAVAASRIAHAHGDGEGARRRLAGALLSADADADVGRIREAFEALFPDPSGRLPASERPRLAERARSLVEDGKAQSAVDVLHIVRPGNSPAAATGDEALTEVEALLKLGRLTEVGPLLTRARQSGPAFADGARYFEAKRAAAVGSFGAYRVGLEALARSAGSVWRERALLDLARMGEGAPSARTVEAYRRYRVAAGTHADPLALLREAWAAYDLGRHAESSAGFARAGGAAGAPDGVRLTATYWTARLAEQAGRAADARAGYARVADEFPNHYYGALAAKRLGRPLPAAPTAGPPAVDPASLGSAGRWLAAGRALVSVGLWEDASPYYRAAARTQGAKGAAVAFEAASAARSAAAISDAIGLAQEAVGDRDKTPAAGIPRELWRLLYPAPSGEPLRKAAAQFGLDADLVASVALQESGFNPLAVSSAGARGLLQVMPAVGAELARSAGLRNFKPEDLYDPSVNLKLGCAHLAEYRRRFQSLPRALAAYNGGPTRVLRWTISGRDDDERFVERIPIPETRIYVKRVLAGARMYAIAWPQGPGND